MNQGSTKQIVVKIALYRINVKKNYKKHQRPISNHYTFQGLDKPTAVYFDRQQNADQKLLGLEFKFDIVTDGKKK